MAKPREYACLCLDSSYILAEVFDNQDAQTRLDVLTEYQKTLRLDIYLPPTVQDECSQRMSIIFAYIGNLIRDFEHFFRAKKSNSYTIGFNDTEFVKEFFSQEYVKQKANSTEIEMLKRMEAFIVNYV